MRHDSASLFLFYLFYFRWYISHTLYSSRSHVSCAAADADPTFSTGAASYLKVFKWHKAFLRLKRVYKTRPYTHFLFSRYLESNWNETAKNNWNRAASCLQILSNVTGTAGAACSINSDRSCKRLAWTLLFKKKKHEFVWLWRKQICKLTFAYPRILSAIKSLSPAVSTVQTGTFRLSVGFCGCFVICFHEEILVIFDYHC